MNYDDAEEHLKSAYLGAAKCLNAFRENGINDDAAQHMIDFEFAVWSMLDRLVK